MLRTGDVFVEEEGRKVAGGVLSGADMATILGRVSELF